MNMKKLTPLQIETLKYCINQIDEARRQSVDISKTRKVDRLHNQRILDAQNGIVLSPGGRCTIRTLKALEQQGLIEIIQDNSGIGMGAGAFPSIIKVLNY
jgi:hypothetical protein